MKERVCYLEAEKGGRGWNLLMMSVFIIKMFN